MSKVWPSWRENGEVDFVVNRVCVHGDVKTLEKPASLTWSNFSRPIKTNQLHQLQCTGDHPEARNRSTQSELEDRDATV